MSGRMRISERNSTNVDDLRDIVRDHWSRPRNPFDEVYPGIFIGDASAALCLSILVREGIGFVVNAADSCDRCLAGRDCGTCVRSRQAFYNLGNIRLKPIAAIDEVGFPLYWYFQEAAEFIDNAVKMGAFGPDPVISVDTNDAFYSSRGYPCEFLGVPAVDLEVFKLHYFFKIGADFIEAALRNNGKVLVHCREGISRSATLVIAYLMMKKGMTAKEAVRLVRNKRQIYPNDGFLGQICDLDLRLQRQRRC